MSRSSGKEGTAFTDEDGVCSKCLGTRRHRLGGPCKYCAWKDDAPGAPPMTKAVEGLVDAMELQRCLWQSLAERCEQALAHRRNKGGQHVGIPDMYGVPVSQLLELKRDAEHSEARARAALEAFAQRSPLRDDADFVCGVLEAYGWHAMAHGPLCDAIEEHVFGPRGAGKGEG